MQPRVGTGSPLEARVLARVSSLAVCPHPPVCVKSICPTALRFHSMIECKSGTRGRRPRSSQSYRNSGGSNRTCSVAASSMLRCRRFIVIR